MIRNDREYQEAVRQNEDQKARLGQHQAALEREGLARDAATADVPVATSR